MTQIMKPRKINDNFKRDLLEGILTPIMECVRKDETLDLEIRHNYIDIYYRGGRMFHIKPISKRGYSNDIDEHFHLPFGETAKSYVVNCISTKAEAAQMAENVKEYKKWIDYHEKEDAEREFEQLIVRENNYSRISNDTDYYIIDIQYATSGFGQFDMVGIQWPSINRNRRFPNRYLPVLTIMEIKYGDQALSGKAGLLEHFEKTDNFLEESQRVKSFKEEMLLMFRTKRELGLYRIVSQSQIEDLAEHIDYLVLLINHKNSKTMLNNELQKKPKMKNATIYLGKANYFGYGLYKECLEECQGQFLTFDI